MAQSKETEKKISPSGGRKASYKEFLDKVINNETPLWIIKRKNLDIKVFFSGDIQGIESPLGDPMFVYNVFTSFIAHLLRMIEIYRPPNSGQSLRDLVLNFEDPEDSLDMAQYQKLNEC